MSRSRSFRRNQVAKAKARARFLWTSIWQVHEHIGEGPFPREGHQPCEPAHGWVCRMASTHCKPCSCPGCGNPRRHKTEPGKGLTLQERRAMIDDVWLLSPAAWRDGSPLELEFDAPHPGPAPYYGFWESHRRGSPRGRQDVLR